MEGYIFEWLNLLFRWLHLITGVAWIGASFYFVWLDNHLRPSGKTADSQRGVLGEVWAVHGGGFYHNEKFLAGPQDQPLPPDLHWFKWEAYWTWMSGMLLLALVYWYGAKAYLIDPRVLQLSVPGAVAISAGLLVVGWLVYHNICRFIRNERLLAVLVVVLLIAADWLLFQLFSPRAAFIHVGVLIGSIMVGNVFFVIIPGQKKTVAAIRAGQALDPAPGLQAKKRSVHNTYFTLPLLFVMISNHYPMTYSHEHGWLVLLGIMLAGALIRQFFVLRHKNTVRLGLPLAALMVLAAVAVALAPAPVNTAGQRQVTAAEVDSIVSQRCASCHGSRPTDPVFTVAPAGVVFDSHADILAQAARIHQRTVVSKDMPFNNSTGITAAERDTLALWYQQLSAAGE